MPQLQSSHVSQHDCVMVAINLNFEVMTLILMLNWGVLAALLFVAHDLLFLVYWYHATKILWYLTAVVSIAYITGHETSQSHDHTFIR
jgi:hypothetical protein